jgi:hypothetical protein
MYFRGVSIFAIIAVTTLLALGGFVFFLFLEFFLGLGVWALLWAIDTTVSKNTIDNNQLYFLLMPIICALWIVYKYFKVTFSRNKNYTKVKLIELNKILFNEISFKEIFWLFFTISIILMVTYFVVFDIFTGVPYGKANDGADWAGGFIWIWILVFGFGLPAWFIAQITPESVLRDIEKNSNSRDAFEAGKPEEPEPEPKPKKKAEPKFAGSIKTEKEALELLGLSKPYTAANLKKRRMEMLKKVHPDQGGSNMMARLVNEAYEILK